MASRRIRNPPYPCGNNDCTCENIETRHLHMLRCFPRQHRWNSNSTGPRRRILKCPRTSWYHDGAARLCHRNRRRSGCGQSDEYIWVDFNGIIDGVDSTSAVDGYCRGAVFLYVVEVVKIKKKRASFSSRETLLSHIKFLKNNQEKI